MNIKKIIVFILWAFLPMIGVGLFLHFTGTSTNQTATPPATSMTGFIFSAGAMLIPLLAVVFTQLIFKESLLKGLGISFKFNRWWWIGWVLMPLLALAVLGMSVLMPGEEWSTDTEVFQTALQQMPEGLGAWGVIAISIVSGLFAGATLNAVFALG